MAQCREDWCHWSHPRAEHTKQSIICVEYVEHPLFDIIVNFKLMLNVRKFCQQSALGARKLNIYYCEIDDAAGL